MEKLDEKYGNPDGVNVLRRQEWPVDPAKHFAERTTPR